MARQSTHIPGSKTAHATGWKGLLLSLVGLPIASTVDYFTGLESSVAIFYLAAAGIAAWLGGRRIGIAVSLCAGLSNLVIQAGAHPLSATDLWNAGIWVGVYLTFSMLLTDVREHIHDFPIFRLLRRGVVTAVVLAFLLGLAGLFIQQQSLERQQIRPQRQMTAAPPTTASTPAEPLTTQRANRLIAELATLLPASLESSRPVLLGSRDPNGPSCVTVVLGGDVQGTNAPPVQADLNGGPGTTMGMLYFFDRQRINTATGDFAWHQTRLRIYLENVAVENRKALEQVQRLASRSKKLADGINNWTSLPADLDASDFVNQDTWLGHCLAMLNAAVVIHDFPAARRWSKETAAAAFALQDLHLWLEFLVENQLHALDFQRLSEPMFGWYDSQALPYHINDTVSRFPAGALSLMGLSNYYEVERQAEGLFGKPGAQVRPVTGDQSLIDAAFNLPPALRETYARLATHLSPHNQRNWLQATTTPYERSYLVNMLFRHWRGDSIENLAQVVKRFDTNYPEGTLPALLGVLTYRGQMMAGVEWTDRYQPSLVEAAAMLHGTDQEAFIEACRWTNSFYRARERSGLTVTLRDAIANKKLDCVRATDMIGALFRNSGRTRFGFVWWSAGGDAHSVAAYLGRKGEQLETLIADGLNPPPELESWPSAYFNGHAWPAGMEASPPPYAVELHVRGIDNYIWAEGYVIRGPSAGTLSKAAIPYLPYRNEKSVKKVFAGPYPG